MRSMALRPPKARFFEVSSFDLSDEEVRARWVDTPYFQYLCGEEFFRHELPFDRSSMTRWRQRMGEERIAALLQESLSVAVKTGR